MIWIVFISVEVKVLLLLTALLLLFTAGTTARTTTANGATTSILPIDTHSLHRHDDSFVVFVNASVVYLSPSLSSFSFFSSSSAERSSSTVTLLIHFYVNFTSMNPAIVNRNKYSTSQRVVKGSGGGGEVDVNDNYSSQIGLAIPNKGDFYNSTLWRYVRVFAKPLPVNTTTTTTDAIIVSKKTMVKSSVSSSSIVARWVKRGRVFQMQLALAAARSYTIYLLKGFDNCSVPLEYLSRDDFRSKRFTTSASLGDFDKISFSSSSSSSSSIFSSDQSSIIASFVVHIPNIPPSKSSRNKGLIDKPKRGNRKYMDHTCSSAGNWVDGLWKPDLSLSLSCSDQSSLSSSSGVDVSSKDYYSLLGKQLCLVGDSHAVRLVRDYNIASEYQNRGGGNVYHQFNAVEEVDIHKVISKEYPWQTGSFSMYQSFMKCVQLISTTTTTTTGDGGGSGAIGSDNNNGVLLWWYGSHALYLSEGETASVASAALEALGRLLHGNQCLIVIGTLDMHYEKINIQNELTYAKVGGENYSKIIPFYQNSFRIQASNDAIHRTVRKFSKHLNVHYLDLYPQSLALHFDGHDSKDAVHFTLKSGFYHYIVDEVIKFIAQKCRKHS